MHADIGHNNKCVLYKTDIKVGSEKKWLHLLDNVEFVFTKLQWF